MRSRFTTMAGMAGLYLIGLAVTALVLFGCASDPDPIYAQAFGYKCTSHEGSTAKMLCNNRPPGEGTEQVSRYCYKSLADANCFDRPDQDRKNQALGSSGY